MNGFRITKYDPYLRSSDGYFLKYEWTSVSDIGKTYPPGVFQLSEYIETETAYVETIRRFLSSAGIGSLQVKCLEIKGVSDQLPKELAEESASKISLMQEDRELSDTELEWAIRLNLRECVWCRLQGKDGFYVHFGYDYYMYVGLESDGFVLPSLPPTIFAEPFKTPYGFEG